MLMLPMLRGWKTIVLVIIAGAAGGAIVLALPAIFARSRSQHDASSQAAGATPTRTTQELAYIQALAAQAVAPTTTPIPTPVPVPTEPPAPPPKAPAPTVADAPVSEPTLALSPQELAYIQALATLKDLPQMIGGVWSVTFTVTEAGGAGVPRVGTIFGRVWTLDAARCAAPNPSRTCGVNIVSSSGSVLKGLYQEILTVGHMLVMPSPKPECIGDLTNVTFDSGADGLFDRFTGTGVSQYGYPGVLSPKKCPFAYYKSSVSGVRSSP